MDRQRNKAFRFLEVIVGIAIIGFIGFASFFGIAKVSANARNADRLDEVAAYATAAEAHFHSKQRYPSPARSGTYCLGRSAAEACWGDVFIGDDSLTNRFAEAMETDPPSGMGQGLGKYAGYLYSCTDAACQGYSIRYLLEGTDQACGRGAYLVRGAAFGRYTQCQALTCPIGTAPKREAGPGTPYVCK